MKANVTLLEIAIAALWFSAGTRAAVPYTIVDSGQASCYDNRDEITPPKPSQPFYGQDAQFQAHPHSYSSTRYVGKGARGFDKLFGVNFADGRIKGYDLQMPGGAEKTFFVQCVRGNQAYGKNDFHDNGDGSITDRATGLVWSKTDSVKALNWQDSIAWVVKKNAEKFLGHDDWRMPSVKELQSIVDYARCPDTTDSPAIDPVFSCTRIRIFNHVRLVRGGDVVKRSTPANSKFQAIHSESEAKSSGILAGWSS